MTTPLDDFSDEYIAFRAWQIRTAREMANGLYDSLIGESNEQMVTMGDIIDETFDCKRCSPILEPGRVVRRLRQGHRCRACGRVG